MGNSVVSKLKISLQKDDQNPEFHSAATKKLKGIVYLYIAWKTDFQQLEIRLLGHEHTHIGNAKKQKHPTKPVKHVLINKAFTLTTAGTFERGNYEFPFEIDLPSGLPASACGGKLGSNIRKVTLGMKTPHSSWYCGYMLEARLHRPGMLTWDVFEKKNVRLCDEPKQTIYHPIYVDPDHHTVRMLGCCKRGYMTLGGQLTSNNVAPGDETFEVHYAISNESTSTIKGIEVIILEHVNYTNGVAEENDCTVILRKRIDAIDIGPQNDISPKKWRELQTITAPIDSLLANLHDRSNGIQLRIPNDVRCSWVGTLIKITHSVQIKAVTPFFVSNPSIEFNICIHGNGNRYQAARVSFANQESTNEKMSVLPIGEVRDSTDIRSSAPELPEDWKENLTIAVPISMAVPHPQLSNIEDDTVSIDAWPDDAEIISPSAPPISVNATTGGLLEDMRNAIDEIAVLRDWITIGHGQVHMITEDVFGEIFACLKHPHSYIEASEILGEALRSISVHFILRAARKVQPNTPETIVGTCTCLAKYCNDRENANLLRELHSLSVSDFMVELTVRAVRDARVV